MSYVAKICSGAGNFKTFYIQSKIKYGLSLSRRSEQISSACENLLFVLNNTDFLYFLL